MTVRVKSNAWRGIRDNPNPHQGLAGLNLAHQAWRKDAACKDKDSEQFYPPKGGDGKRITAEAKAICNRCSVIADCLQFALDTGERHGIFGGLTPMERANLPATRRAGATSGGKPAQDHEGRQQSGPGGGGHHLNPGPNR